MKVILVHMDTMNLSTKNPFRRQPQLILQMPEDEGWCPWDRLDDSHDDALATAGLANPEGTVIDGGEQRLVIQYTCSCPEA